LEIFTLTTEDEAFINQAAVILFEGFQELWPNTYPDFDAAREGVERILVPDWICRVAVDQKGHVVGLIGATREYDGHAWCLYPLAVRLDRWGQGVGRALVEDLEGLVREREATTLYLGTDDTAGMTTLGNVDLYPNVQEHIANIKNLRRHPYEFYQKLGYAIVGVIPDANGIGKPDIIMAKRLSD
jgi:aminoglycoside 6'-N-acetyltransferase I